jgi:hypothetical protein
VTQEPREPATTPVQGPAPERDQPTVAPQSQQPATSGGASESRPTVSANSERPRGQGRRASRRRTRSVSSASRHEPATPTRLFASPTLDALRHLPNGAPADSSDRQPVILAASALLLLVLASGSLLRLSASVSRRPGGP